MKVTLSCLVILFASLSLAEEVSVAEKPEGEGEGERIPIIEQYVIKPGDTLAKLARKYLGDDAAWDTNLSINQDIANTNALAPGQVVNIIVGYKAPPVIVVEAVEVEIFQATIELVSNDVDKNIRQSDWQDAARGDQLNPLDAVRTLANSSAVLRFDQSTEVLVTEYSQVFLRALEAQDSGISRSEIEIKRGETELRLEQTDTLEQSLEINIAGTITRPERGTDGQNAMRARIIGDDSSQVMVYAGSSAVESGGVSVDVETGMGTTAVAGQAPAKPERLLEAPVLETVPGPGNTRNTTFTWQPVETASVYRLDVCRDPRCTKPLYSQRDITWPQHTVAVLPAGQVFWRVTAVSASGLDGFTSEPGVLSLEEQTQEPTPNYVVVALAVLSLLLVLFMVLSLKGAGRDISAD